MKLKILLRLIGAIQIVLGLGYLFAPQALLHSMGHSTSATDLNYPLGMLAARFLVYGIVLIIISRAAFEHRLWISSMVFIQLIDFSVGVFYTVAGIVPLSLSGFPMFNALWISVLLWFWRPTEPAQTK